MSDQTAAAAAFTPLRSLSTGLHWCVLAAITVALSAVLALMHLSGALLLGPMLAAILVDTGRGEIEVPRLPFTFAQAVIGCLIARVLTVDIFTSFLARWPTFLGVVVAVLVASCALGYLISRVGILPDTTAIWGLLPGAASVMMLMAEDFGADMRLVACMQYLRVVCVASAAAVVGRLWAHSAGSAPAVVWFPNMHWPAAAATGALILVGVVLGRRLRIPAGALFLPMIGGAVLHGMGLIELELPPWLLGASYLLLGWSIGLRFTWAILSHAFRAMPQILLSIVALMAFCGLLAALLVWTAGVDPLTAYLATSPGGADSVAVIAASSRADMPFVMALQTVRFVGVLAFGPFLSRWVAGLLLRPLPSK